MVVLLVLLDASDDGGRPLDYQVLQAVTLVQIRVHKLLHSLSWQSALLAFLVKLRLLLVYVVD